MRRLWLLTALLCAGCVPGDEPRPRPPAPWTTFHDTAHAFTISYPRSWQRAPRSLTPGLFDPREILTLSTHEAHPAGVRCGHVPENAMRDMGRGDVLLTFQERRGSGGFDERPRPFVLGPTPHAPAHECAERTDIRIGQVGFRDAGRGLHVYAVLGPGAPEAARRDIERVVDSLKLEPPWRYRGMDVRMQPPSGWRVKARGNRFGFGSWDVPEPPDQRCALPAGAPRSLPADGAYVYVAEVIGLERAQRMRFPNHQPFSLLRRDRRSHACFGDSWRFRWRERDGRVFLAHAYLGARAGPTRKRELRAALRSIVALPR